MGGCYSGSYDYAPSVSRPATPQWRTKLRQALKNQDLEGLTDAYKLFFADSNNSSGFIAEAAKVVGVSRVEDIPKEFDGTEYEVKFDIRVEGKGNEPNVRAYLNAFDFPASTQARFLKDPINTSAEGINHFYGTDDEERLVVIEKSGTHLKEKSEFIPINVGVQYQEIVTKRSEKRYPASVGEIVTKVARVCAESGVKYRGKIRKEKGDVFVLDNADGRIYSVTFTRSHLVKAGEESESAIQRQLEMEYAGYLPGFDGFKKDSEEQIVSGMVDLAKYTYALYGNAPLARGWKMRLSPTTERKYDFVAGGGRALGKRNGELEKVLKKPLALPARVK